MSGSVVNVCFHGIGEPRRTLEPGEAPYWIGKDQYCAILDELVTWPSVSISFDDGNDTDVEHGLPALVDRGLSATFFVLAGRIDQPGSLSRAAIAELRDAGMKIGTHGMFHRPWTGLTDAEATSELTQARAVIEEAAAAPISEAACPLGRYDRVTLRRLRSAGYERVYTSDRAIANTGAWLQPRFSVTDSDDSSKFHAAVSRERSLHRRAAHSMWSTYKRWR